MNTILAQLAVALKPRRCYHRQDKGEFVEDAKKGIVRPRKSITQDNVNAPRPAAGTPGAE